MVWKNEDKMVKRKLEIKERTVIETLVALVCVIRSSHEKNRTFELSSG